MKKTCEKGNGFYYSYKKGKNPGYSRVQINDQGLL
jgi:hypothetical protein